jgi:hypothetical protein
VRVRQIIVQTDEETFTIEAADVDLRVGRNVVDESEIDRYYWPKESGPMSRFTLRGSLHRISKGASLEAWKR